jgi:LacI family transcriptional regulator
LIQPQRVVVRASTDTIAAENPGLAEILQHIHEQVGDPWITVKELCIRFNLSRHALEALFRVGKLNPPGRLIHDVRLRRAFVQLAHSSMSIQQIASDCGFGSSRSFCRRFRQTAGASPEVWRKKKGSKHPFRFGEDGGLRRK